MKSSSFLPFSLVMIGVLLLGMLAFAPQSAVAAPAALPTRPPTATPGGTPLPVVGALIVLNAPTAPATAWTVVQWQDGLGGWHTVEGWQGSFDEGLSKVWWVAPRDFDTGPFRWVVYDKRDGKVWGTSQSFDLPASVGQQVVIDIVKK